MPHPALIIGHTASAPAANTFWSNWRDQWLSLPNWSCQDHSHRSGATTPTYHLTGVAQPSGMEQNRLKGV